MNVGSLLADRFLIESQIGAGGMGVVYRAHDSQTGKTVAIKVLQNQQGSQQNIARFEREARVIAELQHPNIVGYVADGQLDGDVRYLVMEWLEGEDLSRRLVGGPLPLRACYTLLRTVASALAAAHKQGIVHRDIKPSNLFLRQGEIEQTTLLDFGIARQQHSGAPLTRTGVTLGTPSYMSPEQAQGKSAIGPATDIFSLGCVLYECLIGVPPFIAESEGAVLAKVLHAEVASVRTRRPGVPADLDALLSRMLAKDPAARPQTAEALLAEVEQLQVPTADDTPPAAITSAGARSSIELEQQPITVVVAAPPVVSEDAVTKERTAESRLKSPQSDALERGSLLRMMASFGAQTSLQTDGTVVGVLVQGDSARDLVQRAARIALAVRERWTDSRAAIATGQGVAGDGQAIAELISRARRLIRSTADTTGDGDQQPASQDGVALDALSAGLIDSQFNVTQRAIGAVLLGKKDSIDESRLLLGKPTPCVGRDRELGTLMAVMTSCIEDSEPRALLVTAPPGLGKSRLRHEFLRRVAERELCVQILIGSGDPMSAGSPYGILRQLLYRRCALQAGEALELQRAKLREQLGTHLPPAEAPRILEFLGELCNIPFPAENSARLRAARSDPQVMNEQVRQAFVDWARYESAHEPLLFILEDLHWGDALSIKIIDIALRDLSEHPFMVLAFARPEVDNLFPKLWSGRGLKRIQLTELSLKACERLILQILGADADPALVSRIANQAAGNALYLEELIRAVAEGEGKTLPDTVLAMLQARLLRLDSEQRRSLRAASVLGEKFWPGGIGAILGHLPANETLDESLRELVKAEIIEKQRESRFPGQEQYSFRHGLMRDAAYSMMTEQDRTGAHRVAVQFLEKVGEQDPMVLAEHSQRGADFERAIPYYIQAARQADAGYDLDGVMYRTKRGIDCGPKGEQLGLLREMQANACFNRGEMAAGVPAGLEALQLLPAGSVGWCRANSELFTMLAMTGRLQALNELVGAFLATDPHESGRGTYVAACSTLTSMFASFGLRDATRGVVHRMMQVGQPIFATDPIARGWCKFATAIYLEFMEPETWLEYENARDSESAFAEGDALRFVSYSLNVLSNALIGLGRWQAGEQQVRRSCSLASRLNDAMMLALARSTFIQILADHPDPAIQDEVFRMASEQLARPMLSPIHTSMVQGGMARLLIKRKQLAEAERVARDMYDLLAMLPPMRLHAHAILSSALLAQGKVEEARAIAEEGTQFTQFLGGYSESSLDVKLALAESRHAAQDIEGAQAALRDALAELDLRTSKITDPDFRDSFLTQVPTNARIKALASSWLT